MKYKYTVEELKNAVNKSLSIAGVCRELGIVPAGGNYTTINARIKKEGISTAHFTGKLWSKGKHYDKKPVFELAEILVEGRYYQTCKLKQRLIQEGYKQAVCECCGLSTWMSMPIKLELHHINGVNTDNRLENLQLLCPNCHAYTDNYRGKNRKSAHSEKNDVEQPKFEEALTDTADGNLEPSLNEEGVETRQAEPKSAKPPKVKHCKYCDKEFIGKRVYCSDECYSKARKSGRPPVFDLINAFKQYKSYLAVGKHYGVTDNAVRKWVRLYQIEDTVKE